MSRLTGTLTGLAMLVLILPWVLLSFTGYLVTNTGSYLLWRWRTRELQ